MSGAGGDDPCVQCGEPTVRQGHLFRYSVNRERTADGSGWLCQECAQEAFGMECEECGQTIPIDEEVRVTPYEDLRAYCPDCYDEAKHGPREDEA